MTYRIYALTDDQIESLLQFLEWVPDAHEEDQKQRPECPLPILGDDDNLTRVDPDVAIPMHNVFRDRWERTATWKDYSDYKWGNLRGRPRNALDWPELKRRRVPPRDRGEEDGRRRTLGDHYKDRQDGQGPAPRPGT